MLKTIAHNPENVAAPEGGYTHGLEMNQPCRYLFISGTIPEQPDGTIPETFGEQCEVVWNNIEKILADAGLDVTNIVKVTTFLTDRSQVDENGRIRRKHLGEVRPALTVMVAQTLYPEWLVEIEAIAAFEA